MAGHRREHDGVLSTVADENRYGQRGVDVRVVDLTRDQRAADLRRDDHIPTHRVGPLFDRQRLRGARMHEPLYRRDVRLQVWGRRVEGVVEESGTDVFERWRL